MATNDFDFWELVILRQMYARVTNWRSGDSKYYGGVTSPMQVTMGKSKHGVDELVYSVSEMLGTVSNINLYNLADLLCELTITREILSREPRDTKSHDLDDELARCDMLIDAIDRLTKRLETEAKTRVYKATVDHLADTMAAGAWQDGPAPKDGSHILARNVVSGATCSLDRVGFDKSFNHRW